MKRYLLIVLAVLILSCFLIACDQDKGGKGDDISAIIGTWTCSEGGTTWNLKFNADGSYTIADGDNVESFEGKYSLEGNKWIGTVTNLSDFFTFYTSDDPCYAFRVIVDDTHRKLAFSDVYEDPVDYNDYNWDDTKKIYYYEESAAEYHDYWYYKIVDTSYEYNSTSISKDGSGNEVYKVEIHMLAKAELMPSDPPTAENVFAKFYDYDTSKCSEKLTISYKLDGNTLTLWWLGTERSFTRK